MPSPTDYLFLGLVVCILISTALSFSQSHWKEYTLLLLCMPLPYFAGRLMTIEQMKRLPQAVLTVGTIFTVFAAITVVASLAKSGISGTNRTAILGLPHTQTVFAAVLGCTAIAFAHSGVNRAGKLGGALLTLFLVTTAVLVTALVRFTIIAMIVVLALSAVVFARQHFPAGKRTALAALLACLLGVATAIFIRPVGVTNYVKEGVVDIARDVGSSITSAKTTEPPSCTEEIENEDRSVHVRYVLLRDGLFFLKSAGLFGFGIDSFPELTCLSGGYQLHNIYLQTFVEAGYAAGFILIVLVLWPTTYLRFSRIDPDCILARNFLVMSLAFLCIIGLVHGTISRSFPIFLILGALSSFYSNEKRGDQNI